MRSLFIVSLPRSLSTNLLEFATDALELRTPSWVTAGEILNLDRVAMYRGPRVDECPKYTTRENNPNLFGQLLDYLDQVTVTEGFIYKDVVQPFVVAAWPGIRNFRVLRIRRDIAEVAMSLLGRGWLFPRSLMWGTDGQSDYFGRVKRDHRAFGICLDPRSPKPAPEALARELIDALLLADRALDSILGYEVRYEDLITTELSLADAFQHLYPEGEFFGYRYLTEGFQEHRDELLRRRFTPLYEQLRTLVAERRALI